MLGLPAEQLKAIQAHALEAYPHECCGILLGTRQGNGRASVAEARRAANLNTERARDRYQLDPRDQLRAEKDARARGLEVLGYYHSHPDHPALPSATDNELSWEGYAYLILSVRSGQPDGAACFSRGRLGDELLPEELQIL